MYVNLHQELLSYSKSSFYPTTLDPKDYLTYYSSIFDFVEVNLGDRTVNQYDKIKSLLQKEEYSGTTGPNILSNANDNNTYWVLSK